LLQANTVGKRFINGELSSAGDSGRFGGVGRWPVILKITAHLPMATPSRHTPPRANGGRSVGRGVVAVAAAVHQQQFYVSISRVVSVSDFHDDTERLRSHVTHSSERLAAVEVVPHFSRQKFILRVMERGHRFLKQFRQQSPDHFQLKPRKEQP